MLELGGQGLWPHGDGDIRVKAPIVRAVGCISDIWGENLQLETRGQGQAWHIPGAAGSLGPRCGNAGEGTVVSAWVRGRRAEDRARSGPGDPPLPGQELTTGPRRPSCR